ncbi:MAG: hypothetical protein ABI067_06990 [Leifsonia sp.]
MDTQKELTPGIVLPKVADTLTERAVKLTIDVKPKNKLEAWLIKRGFKPSKRFFEIKPQRVANVYRIAGRAVKLDTGKLFQTEDRIGSMMDVIARHGEDIFYIVACAIQNDHREPTDEMIEIVKNEFEMNDILKVMQIAVSNYNINAFLNTIALTVGVDALNTTKASPEVNGG